MGCEVEAAIGDWYLKNGAMSWGYPRSSAADPMRRPALREVDAADAERRSPARRCGGELQGLTADITRTYPVNGKFSPEQRAIYEPCSRDRKPASRAKLGAHGGHHARDSRCFGEGLFKLGLITESAPGPARDAQVGRWFPHGPTHGIGVDVHDPLGAFAPGSAFTIEPGLYIRQDTLDNLPKNADNQKFIEAVQPAVNKYKNIGVRIEDSFLTTESGLVNLSIKAPRQIADIEKIVGTGR
jgi:Xaa-Pro aminopeptidase